MTANGRECLNLCKITLMTADPPPEGLDMPLQPRLREPHFSRLLQPLHYYGAQSWAQTKSHQQHDRVRRSQHPVMGCQVVTRTVDTSIACWVILPNRNDPVTPNRALQTSMIMRTFIGMQIINHYFRVHSYHSSPYDLLPDGTVME